MCLPFSIVSEIPCYPLSSTWFCNLKNSMFQGSCFNRITIQGKLCETSSGTFSREMLDREKCYILDCDAEVYVWMGRCTSISERKTSITATEVRKPSFPPYVMLAFPSQKCPFHVSSTLLSLICTSRALTSTLNH